MKKLVLVLVAVLSMTTAVASNEKPSDKAKRQLRAKIVKLLGKADFSFSEEITAQVNFLVNKKGEIIVLSVNSANANVDSYVKRKLNYRRINPTVNGTVQMYKMPIRIVSKL